MNSIRVPVSVCSVVSELYSNGAGSHATLEALFEAVGCPGSPPNAAHHLKWKTWLIRTANDPTVDALSIIGQLLSEFMDLPPDQDSELYDNWQTQRDRIVKVFEESGFRYFRGGRILPIGDVIYVPAESNSLVNTEPPFPANIDALLGVLVRGLPRAMHPLTHRRKGSVALKFDSEYDIQDLLHSLLRPWVVDIRPEEYTPSYAGSSTRMDFLLPQHEVVIETKLVRSKDHGRKIGDEFIIDIEHYCRHPNCKHLWCVIYDPNHLIPNPGGLKSDLDGTRSLPDGSVTVNVVIVST